MAREKMKIRSFKMPTDAPDGMVFEDVKRTVGDTKGAVIRVLVPQRNAEGVREGVKFLTSIGVDGPEFTAEAQATAMVASQVAQAGANGTPISDIGSIVPRISKLSTVNKAMVAGARLTEFVAEHGRPPSQTEYKEIYAGLSL